LWTTPMPPEPIFDWMTYFPIFSILAPSDSRLDPYSEGSPVGMFCPVGYFN